MKNIRQLQKIFVSPSLQKTTNRPDQFPSALAHELRNPLSNIILSTNELGILAAGNDHVKLYLDIIIRGAARINKVVEMLLKWNASETMKQEEYSLHQLLEEALEVAGDRIRLKHVLVSRNYETQDFKTFINVQEMKMALINIIINALDAMDRDIGQLKIITRYTDGKFVIEIVDNGCGIKEENLKNIFTPFFTNKPGGLGVGLAATYGILQSNHVGVNIKSEEGKGTCFSLLFDKSINKTVEYG